ncbi:MAG: metallophosphoesterase [Nannocystaceae bacterium]
MLLISDLHLGSHLKPRMRGEHVHLAARIDEVLPRFLDHYRGQGPWQLIINGDFIDFWNIELGRDAARDGEALAIHRLHATFDAYPGVEDALVRFLEAGNTIAFVTGNHDAELLYSGVRAAIRERLEGAVDERAGDAGDVTGTGTYRLGDVRPGRVHFVSWFLHEPGSVWIEHGHLFDAACSTTDQLSPTRGGRLVQSLAEVATRSFSNLMPEIDYDAPDRYTTVDYIRWAVARGLRFVLLVIFLYLRMVGRMLALWVRTGRVDREGRAQHQERLERIAENAGLQMSTLSALQEMAPPPISATVAGVLTVSALDLLLTLLTITALGGLVGRWIAGSWLLGLAVGAGLGLWACRGIQRRRRKRAIADEMSEVAAEVGRVTEVPLVLMGHSHHGSIEVHGGVVYGNSGCWLDGSHLVIRRDRSTGRPRVAELRRWRNGGVSVVQRVEIPAAVGAPVVGAAAAA